MAKEKKRASRRYVTTWRRTPSARSPMTTATTAAMVQRIVGLTHAGAFRSGVGAPWLSCGGGGRFGRSSLDGGRSHPQATTVPTTAPAATAHAFHRPDESGAEEPSRLTVARPRAPQRRGTPAR